MGEKFGNFSILNISFEETVKLLEFYPQEPITGDYLKSVMKSLIRDNKPQTEELNKFVDSLAQISNLEERIFYIGTRGKWTTVYSEDFFTGNEINIMPLTNVCNNTFVISEVFDGDVFGLAVIKKGVLLTRHVSGATDTSNDCQTG